MFEFVFQAVTKRSHAELIRELLTLPRLRRVIMSVAFANASGVALIEGSLRSVRARVKVFVGIRNDVTSAQGLKRLLPVVNQLFIVDTGSRNRIFHPKIYLARSQATAHIVVGSANLTTGGLWNNIEASLKIEANLARAAERAVIEDVEAQFDGLLGDFPQHVVVVTTDAEIDALLAAGRVTDESVAERPRPTAKGTDRDFDTVPRIRLALTTIQPPVQRSRQPAAARGGKGKLRPRDVAPDAGAGYELLWESNELKERSLNIPSGVKTARTGSMLFTKGRLTHQSVT